MKMILLQKKLKLDVSALNEKLMQLTEEVQHLKQKDPMNVLRSTKVISINYVINIIIHFSLKIPILT